MTVRDNKQEARQWIFHLAQVVLLLLHRIEFN